MFADELRWSTCFGVVVDYGPITKETLCRYGAMRPELENVDVSVTPDFTIFGHEDIDHMEGEEGKV